MSERELLDLLHSWDTKPSEYEAAALRELQRELDPDATWTGEVCKCCWRRNVIGFEVPNDVWAAVSQGRFNVMCPTCFDREAEVAGVRYSFGALWPVTWSTP